MESDGKLAAELNPSKLMPMKPVLAFILLCLLTACANKPNDNMQDPAQTKADIKAREDFAKALPKPADR